MNFNIFFHRYNFPNITDVVVIISIDDFYFSVHCSHHQWKELVKFDFVHQIANVAQLTNWSVREERHLGDAWHSQSVVTSQRVIMHTVKRTATMVFALSVCVCLRVERVVECLNDCGDTAALAADTWHCKLLWYSHSILRICLICINFSSSARFFSQNWGAIFRIKNVRDIKGRWFPLDTFRIAIFAEKQRIGFQHIFWGMARVEPLPSTA